MNKKIIFTFAAVTILLASFILSVAVNQQHIQIAEYDKSSTAKLEGKKFTTMEISVQIYMLNGVKEIEKELPVKDAKEIFSLSNKTGEAVKTLLSAHATFKEKVKANEVIDLFLYKMRNHGLLGDLSIQQARKLITGKYLQKETNSIEMQKMEMIANLLSQNRWQINAMCYFEAEGEILGIFSWSKLLITACVLITVLSFVLWHISPFFLPLLILLAALHDFLIIEWLLLDAIPHATTIGHWEIKQGYYHPSEASTYTLGLLGEKSITGSSIEVWTIGFTGMVLHSKRFDWLNMAIGFCPFIAME